MILNNFCDFGSWCDAVWFYTTIPPLPWLFKWHVLIESFFILFWYIQFTRVVGWSLVKKNQKKNRQLYKGIHGFLRVYICLVVVGVGWVGRVILWRPGTKKKCEIEKYMQIVFSKT